MTLSDQITQAANDLRTAAAGVSEPDLTRLTQALHSAHKIVLYGCGREGLMIRALAMRLYHAGLDAHMVGDMACPPVGPGDLFLASSGPGHLSTVAALMRLARSAGATTACITAEPTGPDPQSADLTLHIPAQTMASDKNATCLLPMGSVFEGAQFLIFEIMILRLRDLTQQSPAEMRARHTNLE